MYKIDGEYLNKNSIKQLEGILKNKEVLHIGFEDKFFLPKTRKSLEIIHVDSSKISNILRLLRDKPAYFIDYLTKDEPNIPEDALESVTLYFSDKRYNKILKNMSKLDLDEIILNIKNISSRIKKTFIVYEKLDAIIKNCDSSETVLVGYTNNLESLDVLTKSKILSQIIIKNCKKNVSEFLTKNNYKILQKNVFYKLNHK